MEKTYKIISKTKKCDGYLKLNLYVVDHAGFGGTPLLGVTREVVENGVAVVVLPYDPVRDCIVVTEQFRIGAMVAGRDPWVLGLVAGMLASGETVEDVARREALEEIGCSLGRIEEVAEFMPSPGTSSEVVHVCVAEVDCSKAGHVCGVASEQEDIRVSKVSAEEALERFSKGDFASAGSVVALQWFAANRDMVRRRWTVSEKAGENGAHSRT